jgi:hypothetical protein
MFIILFGNNLIQNSYLALIKPYWQIITSYRLALQVLYELVESFSCLQSDKNPFMAVFLKHCGSPRSTSV